MVRVVTLNLNYYVDKHGPWDQRKRLIIEQLKEKRPDIVAFQAVAAHPGLYGGSDQAGQIMKELAGFQTHYFEEAQRQPDGLIQGSALISKLPLSDRTAKKLTLRPGTDDNNERVLQRAVFEVGNEKLEIYNAHVSWVQEQAALNISEAVQFMAEGNRGSVLFVGDLNNGPESDVFDPLKKAGFNDAWNALHPEERGYTFESDKLSLRIDYFWFSVAVAGRLKRMERLSAPPDAAARLSDHLGLMLELDFD